MYTLQAMTPVTLKAVQLTRQVKGQLNDVNTKAQNVTKVNMTQVVPSQQSCDQYESPCDTVEVLSSTAQQAVTNASKEVNDTKTATDQILANLRRINKLDVKQIDQLSKSLNQTRVQFDSSELAKVIMTLKIENQKQQRQISDLKLRRDKLQQQMRKLKDIQQQLKP